MIARITALAVLASCIASPAYAAQSRKIASNFDVASELQRAQSGTGEIPPSAAPDNVGAFRFVCAPGQINSDDPIIYPGQPGASHPHQWFGNTGGNAKSTYKSLRTTGDSTCMNRLNRSAYWIPVMLNGVGFVVRPDWLGVYYKRYPQSSPLCLLTADKGCAAMPRGLRYVFGYDMLAMRPGEHPGVFDCQGPTATPGRYATIAEAAANCPAGNQLGAIVSSPQCWDGRNLDSPDHRSHMAYPAYVGKSYPQCPKTHSVLLPEFHLGVWYSVSVEDEARWKAGGPMWRFSSDEMHAAVPGSTFHADWWGAWDDNVLAAWTANCIDKLLNCSSGDLGDGRELRGTWPNPMRADPRLVPVPTNIQGRQ